MKGMPMLWEALDLEMAFVTAFSRLWVHHSWNGCSIYTSGLLILLRRGWNSMVMLWRFRYICHILHVLFVADKIYINHSLSWRFQQTMMQKCKETIKPFRPDKTSSTQYIDCNILPLFLEGAFVLIFERFLKVRLSYKIMKLTFLFFLGNNDLNILKA